MKNRNICSILLIMMFLTCTTALSSEFNGAQAKAANENGRRAAQQPTSSSYTDALATLSGLPKRWNQAAAPLVRDYLDPNVPADRWVKEASPYIGELRAVHIEMHARTLAIREQETRKFFQELIANYRAKLDSLIILHNAVARGDQEAEQQAYQALSEASVEGQRLSQALIEKIRPNVNPDALADELSKSSKEIGELMKPK